jgi:glycerol-3-phosphate acyltransferase PlsY
MSMLWVSVAAAYLLGSIPFGYLIARFAGGGDIRRAGSGNIGAANVSRVVGTGAGVLTLLLDAGKGLAAAWLALRLIHGHIGWVALAGLAAVVGHLFPVWLGFRGGRGVATAAGVFVLISWKAVLGAAVVWLIALLIWRYASLSSILAAAALPLLMYVLYAPGYAPPSAISLATTAASVLVIWRHRPNLQRLIAGTEPRFSFRR